MHGERKRFSIPFKQGDLFVRFVQQEEIEAAYDLAKQVYQEDEVPSLQNLKNIYQVASDLCIGSYNGPELIGFVWATRFYGSHISTDTFDTHLPTGESVIIHSVSVAREWQRKGIGLCLLNAFLKHVSESQTGAVRCLLLCHSFHIPFFTRASFVFGGRSSLTLGKHLWYECEKVVKPCVPEKRSPPEKPIPVPKKRSPKQRAVPENHSPPVKPVPKNPVLPQNHSPQSVPENPIVPPLNLMSEKDLKRHLQSLYEKYGTPSLERDRDNRSRSRDRHLRQKSREANIKKRLEQLNASRDNAIHKTIKNCQIYDADIVCPAECPHCSNMLNA